MKKTLCWLVCSFLLCLPAYAPPIVSGVSTWGAPVVDHRLVRYQGVTGQYIEDSGYTVGMIVNEAIAGSAQELDDLNDVNIAVLANGDILRYNAVTGDFENVPLPAVGGGGSVTSTWYSAGAEDLTYWDGVSQPAKVTITNSYSTRTAIAYDETAYEKAQWNSFILPRGYTNGSLVNLYVLCGGAMAGDLAWVFEYQTTDGATIYAVTGTATTITLNFDATYTNSIAFYPVAWNALGLVNYSINRCTTNMTEDVGGNPDLADDVYLYGLGIERQEKQ